MPIVEFAGAYRGEELYEMRTPSNIKSEQLIMKQREEVLSTLFNWKSVFSSSSSARSSEAFKEMNSCNKKRTVERSHIFLLCFYAHCAFWLLFLLWWEFHCSSGDWAARLGFMVPALLSSSTHFISRCIFAGGRPRLLTLCGLGVSRVVWDV